MNTKQTPGYTSIFAELDLMDTTAQTTRVLAALIKRHDDVAALAKLELARDLIVGCAQQIPPADYLDISKRLFEFRQNLERKMERDAQLKELREKRDALIQDINDLLEQ
jgi:hypothetical protein